MKDVASKLVQGPFNFQGILCKKNLRSSASIVPIPRGEGLWKIKKGGGSMVQGQVFLKGGGLAFVLFNFFKVYHF